MSEEALSAVTLLRLQHVSKTFGGQRTVLEDINFDIHVGDRISVVGPSGCGKSTLLNIIAGLDTPSSGTVERLGITNASDLSLAQWRNKELGFVFQDHHLLPHCSVLDNVLLPVCAFRTVTTDDRERAHELLQRVGLLDRAASWPHELSGGERQRIALIRSLIMQPRLILADEPTGALDEAHALEVAQLLDDLQASASCALFIVTHHTSLAERMDRRLHLQQHALQES